MAGYRASNVAATTAQPAVPFDYATLDHASAKIVRTAASAINSRKRKIGCEFIAIGKELLKAKAQLEHGQWEKWLAVECDFTDRTAQRYMQAATVLGEKSDTVSFLNPSTIYALS